jgi:Winged helix-turn helix
VLTARFGVDYHERYVGTLLKELGFSHMSARPRHPGPATDGVPPIFPPKTTSFKQWSEKIWAYARSLLESGGSNEEETYWCDPARLNVSPLPVDDADGSNEPALTQSVAGSLTADETHALLHNVPAASS